MANSRCSEGTASNLRPSQLGQSASSTFDESLSRLVAHPRQFTPFNSFVSVSVPQWGQAKTLVGCRPFTAIKLLRNESRVWPQFLHCLVRTHRKYFASASGLRQSWQVV